MLTGGAQDGAALGEYSGEVLGRHELIVAFYQSPVSVIHAEYLNIFQLLKQRLAHAPYGRVQALAVASAGDERNTGHFFQSLRLLGKAALAQALSAFPAGYSLSLIMVHGRDFCNRQL